MINLFAKGRSSPRMTRRKLLQLGTAGAAASQLASSLGGPLAGWEPQLRAATASDALSHAPTAKRCIFIFLCGGPSQLDLWDPKPAAPAEIRGPFQAISTNVPGIQLGELLPEVSRHADKLAVIRSMTHESNVHDIGILYTLLADSKVPSTIAYPPTREDHPGIGAILKSLLGDQGKLPAWVTVPRPFTTGKRFYKGQSGGFLGPAFDPYFLEEPKQDSLADRPFHPPSLQLEPGLTQPRLTARHQLLREFNAGRSVASAGVEQLDQYYQQAYSMLSSAGASQAFALQREPAALRDRYGRNEYGQSFLLARRLVESGVRMVNVFWTFYGADGCQFNLWDNHGSDKPVCGGFNKGVDMLTAPYCCPAFDKAFSALLEDLAARGLLDDTLVAVAGEFGRTPKINKHAGRDHWAPCYSTVLAGGGIAGGCVYGESDSQAAYVKDRPVRPEDLGATLLYAFGLAPETPIYDIQKRPIRISRGVPVRELFAG